MKIYKFICYSSYQNLRSISYICGRVEMLNKELFDRMMNWSIKTTHKDNYEIVEIKNIDEIVDRKDDKINFVISIDNKDLLKITPHNLSGIARIFEEYRYVKKLQQSIIIKRILTYAIDGKIIGNFSDRIESQMKLYEVFRNNDYKRLVAKYKLKKISEQENDNGK